MFKNHYDTDVTTWSPDGKLFQVEYAMEAVKQGSCAVGAKNKSFVGLGSLKRAPHVSLSSYQAKLFEINDYCGIAIAGLAADGRVLCKLLRTESLNHEYLYNSTVKVSDLVDKISKKSQASTQRAGNRPFGVGLLVSGIQNGKPKLYQTCPSGKIYDYKGTAIGARSQSARTYVEKNLEKILKGETEEELVLHILRALRKTTTENVTLDVQNTEVTIIGKDQKYKIYDETNNTEKLKEYLEMIEKENEKTEEKESDEMEVDQ